MNSPFVLTDLCDNTWSITWPTIEVIFTDNMRINLLDLVFKEIKCYEVGLGIADDDTNNTTMWIKQDIFFRELTEEYTQYLYRYYKIVGAVFHEKHQAEQLRDILEKKYVWQLLKE